MSETTERETLGFQAEVKQLLDLMIHSLYSNKEIFLRELVSNASDAADKLRFEAIADPALYGDDPELDIRVSFDKAARTITIADNGIGMSRDEVIANIGTIAKSGTREFFQALTGDQAKDANLIGQFGVGFYSVFIVADRVTLETRRAGLDTAQGVRWESAGGGEYTLEPIARPARGTSVTLHVRAGEDDFLFELKGLVRPKPLIELPKMLGIHDAHHSLSLRRQFRNVPFRVDIEPAHEDAVDRFERVAIHASQCTSPTGIAGGHVLSLAEDQRDIDRDARCDNLLQRRDSAFRGRNLDHAILVADRPLPGEFDVPRSSFGRGLRIRRIFDQRVQQIVVSD